MVHDIHLPHYLEPSQSAIWFIWYNKAEFIIERNGDLLIRSCLTIKRMCCCVFWRFFFFSNFSIKLDLFILLPIFLSNDYLKVLFLFHQFLYRFFHSKTKKKKKSKMFHLRLTTNRDAFLFFFFFRKFTIVNLMDRGAIISSYI